MASKEGSQINELIRIFLIIKVVDKPYHVTVKELPSFHAGMCYLIETSSNLDLNDARSTKSGAAG